MGGLKVDDDEVIGLDAVAVATRITVEAEPYAAIGLEAADHPVGTVIPTDELGATPVPGVWAAGNCADLMAQVGGAAAQGVRVAQHINGALVLADLTRAIEARRAPGSGAVVPGRAEPEGAGAL